MKTSFLPILLTVASMAIYHLAQKTVPANINPFVALAVAYVTGIVLYGVGFLFSPGAPSFVASLRAVNGSVFALGGAAAAIEIGFLLAYRAGWDISLTGTLTSTAGALLLIPIGVVFFKERLTAWNIVGLACCLIGLLLVAKK